jgi:hypothetical protein
VLFLSFSFAARAFLLLAWFGQEYMYYVSSEKNDILLCLRDGFYVAKLGFYVKCKNSAFMFALKAKFCNIKVEFSNMV